MQTSMNIWWQSQQKASVCSPASHEKSKQGGSTPADLSCGELQRATTARSDEGPWTHHDGWKPLDLTTWISITEKWQVCGWCAGGVQSFLIRAILLSRRLCCKLLCCSVYITYERRDDLLWLDVLFSYIAFLNDSSSLRGLHGDIPFVSWESLLWCAVEDIQKPQYSWQRACRLWVLRHPQQLPSTAWIVWL